MNEEKNAVVSIVDKILLTLAAMTRQEWEAQPESFKYFHKWDRAKKPLKIIKQTTHKS